MPGVMDNKYAGAPGSPQFVNVRNDPIHVLRGVFVAHAEVAGKRIDHDQYRQALQFLDHIGDLIQQLGDAGLFTDMDRLVGKMQERDRLVEAMVYFPCFESSAESVVTFASDENH